MLTVVTVVDEYVICKHNFHYAAIDKFIDARK